jgi:hypothetical protein
VVVILIIDSLFSLLKSFFAFYDLPTIGWRIWEITWEENWRGSKSAKKYSTLGKRLSPSTFLSIKTKPFVFVFFSIITKKIKSGYQQYWISSSKIFTWDNLLPIVIELVLRYWIISSLLSPTLLLKF